MKNPELPFLSVYKAAGPVQEQINTIFVYMHNRIYKSRNWVSSRVIHRTKPLLLGRNPCPRLCILQCLSSLMDGIIQKGDHLMEGCCEQFLQVPKQTTSPQLVFVQDRGQRPRNVPISVRTGRDNTWAG